jgi:hypothetical protein
MPRKRNMPAATTLNTMSERTIQRRPAFPLAG